MDEFIRILKQKTPEGVNTVNLLIDIFPMSKEAAYRRLRGQIDFTFEEVLKIARKLNISLDALIKPEDNQMYKVKVVHISEDSFMDDYIRWETESLRAMKELRSFPEHYAFTVNSNISLLYLFNYEMLSKLRIYKWMYQCNSCSRLIKMSELIVSPKVIALEKMMLNELRHTRLYFIYSQELIRSLVIDINYFRHLDLISGEEAARLKQEAFSLLDDMERDAILGKNFDMPCTIYVTSVDFGNDIVLWNCSRFAKITFRLFGINHYSIDHPDAIREMKTWTDMLIKSSALISFSGEKERVDFFRRQRKILESLLI